MTWVSPGAQAVKTGLGLLYRPVWTRIGKNLNVLHQRRLLKGKITFPFPSAFLPVLVSAPIAAAAGAAAAVLGALRVGLRVAALLRAVRELLQPVRNVLLQTKHAGRLPTARQALQLTQLLKGAFCFIFQAHIVDFYAWELCQNCLAVGL